MRIEHRKLTRQAIIADCVAGVLLCAWGISWVRTWAAIIPLAAMIWFLLAVGGLAGWSLAFGPALQPRRDTPAAEKVSDDDETPAAPAAPGMPASP
jgi:hypothetical protein